MPPTYRLADIGNKYLTGGITNPFRIHEHDFICLVTEKETSSSTMMCSTCGLIYCDKCGKSVMRHGKKQCAAEQHLRLD